MDTAREAMRAWPERRGGTLNDYVLPSRNDYVARMSTQQYTRLVHEWVRGWCGGVPASFGFVVITRKALGNRSKR